ncbi:MAG: autotransporter outer membrane beta-barrel domain-containing protein [Acetobacter sp.]|nr:autotransporter outer membrane beta-barrel domain-containing protein [Acetobacter sp.]
MMLKYGVSFFALFVGVSGAWAYDIIGQTISDKTNDNMGGALRINGGDDTRWHIEDSEFINNKTTIGGGGAILINLEKNEANFDILIDNTKFEGNQSAGIGGAVWMVRNDADMYVTNSQFINNTGAKGGGAFNSGVNEGKNGKVIYRDNLFEGNKSLLSAANGGDLDGGAVRLDSGHIIFEGVNTFKNNTNPDGKNDIFLRSGVVDVKGKLILDGGITEAISGTTTTTVLEGGEIVANNPDGDTILGNKIINNGTITVNEKYAARFLADSENNNIINNNGKVTVGAGTLTLNKGINGEGAIEIASGAGMTAAGDVIDVQNSVNNQGILSVLANKVLNLFKDVTNGGEIVNNGELIAHNTLENNGTLTNAKTLNLLNGGVNKGTITNANGVINLQGGELALYKGIDGSASGRFNIANGATVIVKEEAVKIENKVNNSGTISVESGKSLQLTQEITNDNTIRNAGTLTTDRQLTNNNEILNEGTFNANEVVVNALGATITNTGTMTVKLGVTNDGTLSNNAGATLSLGNDGTNNGVLANSGTMTVTGGTLTLNKGVSGEGKLEIGTNGTVLANDSLEIANTVDNKGILTVIKDKILTLLKGGENSGEIKVNGTLVATEALSNSGKINIADVAKFEANGKLLNSNEIENNGTLKVNGALVNEETGKIVNSNTLEILQGGENNGEIENNKTMTVVNGSLALNGDITGVGMLTVETEGAILAKGENVTVANAVMNEGAVDVAENAGLTLKNVMTNNGSLTSSGMLMAEQRFENNSSIVNNGTLEFKRGAVNNGTLENGGTLKVVAGLINNKELQNTGDMDIAGGTLTLNGDISGSGRLLFREGAGLKLVKDNVIIGNKVESAAELEINEGKTLKVDNDFVNSGMLTNNGTLFVGNMTNNQSLYNNGKMTAGDMMFASGAKMYLGVDSYTEVENYVGDGADLYLDLKVNATDKKVLSGLLKVNGNVMGTTNVIVNALSPDVFAGASTLFVDAPNDILGTDGSFAVARVIGSPYMWDSKRVGGETKGNQWYLNIAEDKKNDDFEGEIPDIKPNPDNPDPDNPNPDNPDKPNPDKPNPDKPNPDKPGNDKPHKPSNPIYAPEVNAYTGLGEAVIEQNRGVMDDVRSGLAFEKSLLCYQESCGLAEAVPHKRAWVHLSNRSATLDTPSEMKAKIWGFTAGADFYREYDKRAGVFGFYRNGRYDLSGKGKYLSRLGADIDNESFAGGLYYQLDNGDNRILSTMYVGRQNIDFKVDDGFAKADTNANQFGASVEGSKRYWMTDTITLEPGIGVSYMMADIDSFTDSVGKSVSYDVLHYWEVEAGIKAEYTFCEDGLTRRVYVRPSVIQTFAKGDAVKISGIEGHTNTYKDQTLGRLRAGTQFGLTQKLSGFADVGYTFGKDYEAYDAQFGLNYSF